MAGLQHGSPVRLAQLYKMVNHVTVSNFIRTAVSDSILRLVSGRLGALDTVANVNMPVSSAIDKCVMMADARQMRRVRALKQKWEQ